MNINLSATIKADAEKLNKVITEIFQFCEKHDMDGHLSIRVSRKENKWSDD